MQSYDIADSSIVWIALGQKGFQRFTDPTQREIARCCAAAAKVVHRGVESLPTRASRRFHEQCAGKAFDMRKFCAKKVEIALARKLRRVVAMLDQGFNGDRLRTLGLFVERFALRVMRTVSQDNAPVCRRR